MWNFPHGLSFRPVACWPTSPQSSPAGSHLCLICHLEQQKVSARSGIDIEGHYFGLGVGLGVGVGCCFSLRFWSIRFATVNIRLIRSLICTFLGLRASVCLYSGRWRVKGGSVAPWNGLTPNLPRTESAFSPIRTPTTTLPKALAIAWIIGSSRKRTGRIVPPASHFPLLRIYPSRSIADLASWSCRNFPGRGQCGI